MGLPGVVRDMPRPLARRGPGRTGPGGPSLPVLVAALLAIAACASPLRYRPLDAGGGFSDRAIDDRTHEVTFEGSEDATTAELRKYLRYRCAQLTLERGADAFVVLRRESLSLPVPKGSDASSGRSGRGRAGRKASAGGSESAARGAQPRSEMETRPAEVAVIQLWKGERPEFGEDARATLSELGPEIRR